MNILVLGASGMLGAALVTRLAQRREGFGVFGTHRPSARLPVVPGAVFIEVADIFDEPGITHLLANNDIGFVINAIGLIKQIGSAFADEDFVLVNAMLPHFMARLAGDAGARFLEVSTDCVFSGRKGLYTESDTPDATDMYGRSKLLGEVTERNNSITIRTSIIGHESGRAASLIDWFLSTEGTVNGFSKAVFSGFPAIVLADIIADHFIPKPELSGLYHVSADPIDKFSLLCMVRDLYRHDVEVEPSDTLIINRTLNSTKFRQATGFVPSSWPELINAMKTNRPNWSAV